MKRHALACGLILGVAMLVGVDTASAGTCAWIGGGNPNWSTPSNWLCSGGVTRAPVNGDSLTFPATALTFTSTNDIPNLQPASILISSPRYTITGVGISLAGEQALEFNGPFYSSIVHGSTFRVPITLTNAVTVTNDSPDQQDLWLGDVNLNGFELTVDVAPLDVIHELGVISGNGQISKVDGGTLRLENDATFSGRLFVNAGALHVLAAHALGASGGTNETLLADQTTLGFIGIGAMTVDESIVFLGKNGLLSVEDPVSTGLAVTFTGEVVSLPDPSKVNLLEPDGTGDRMIMAGPVVGGAFQVTGGGLLTFANPADDWSQLQISVATVRLGAAGVLPAGAALTISPIGTLDLNGFDANIGALAADGGSIVLGTHHLTTTCGATQTTTVKAGLVGTGTLTKAGAGTLGFQGMPNTPFTGTLALSAGRLLLGNTAVPNMFAGPIIVNGGTLELAWYDQIGDAAPVTIDSPGVLQLDNMITDTIGSLAGSGTVSLGNGKLTTGGNNSSTTFSGVITGLSGAAIQPFVKKGTGTMTLTGQNTFTGTTVIAGGTLVVNGSLSNTGKVLGVLATLAGMGSVGNYSAQFAGTDPGNGGPGVLHVTSAEFTNGSIFNVDLNGLAPGTGYDQLDSSGDVALSVAGSPTLNVTRRVGPPQGTRFTIINVAPGRTLSGTFAGQPEGSTMNLQGQTYSISYKGGDGNDVVLTAVDPPPAVTYYLSEGATGAFFDEDVLIANPNASAAPVTLTFSKEDGSQVTATQTIPAQGRVTVHVDQMPGLEATAASAQVRSDQGLPLVVERTMFWDRSYYAGHTGSAVDRPATDWFFAEGSQGFFNTFVLVINPNATPSEVTFTFLRESEAPVTRTITVGAQTRLTLDCGSVPEIVNRSFGITVHASQPIMAERSMYFGTTPTRLWSGGTESAGVTALSTHWFLAEGATGSFFDTFILLSNPHSTPANVTLQYLLESGETVSVSKVVPANARLTTNIETEDDPRLRNAAVSTVVIADQPIIAERSMYWPGAAVPWGEGHNSFGVVEAGVHWGLAEGRTGGPLNFHTYILLANPQSTPATVSVTLLREQGAAPVVKTYTVPPTSRFNIDSATIPELQNESFGADIQVTNGVAIIVERSMYWDSNGFQFSGGTNATATRLP